MKSTEPSARLVEELEIIKKKTIVAGNELALPLIIFLLNERRKCFFLRIQTFQIFAPAKTSVQSKEKNKTGGDSDTLKVRCIIRREISIHVKLILKLNITCVPVRNYTCAVRACKSRYRSNHFKSLKEFFFHALCGGLIAFQLESKKYLCEFWLTCE